MLKLKGKLVFTVVLLWGLVCGVFAYPDGAPERACYRMIPRHTHPFSGRAIRAQPANIKPPYNITLSRNMWNPDVPITVTIHGGAPFKGFMLMAAEDSLMDMPTGKFFANGATDVKTMFCSFPGDGATHTDSKWKAQISVDWYAPAITSADHMQFIATIVTNRSTVWTNIKSAFLQADPAVSEGPEYGEAAEGGMMPGGLGGAGGGLDQWGYPISTTPGYGGWGGGAGVFGGGFGRGVTQGYTTVSPDIPVRSEAGSSRSRAGRRQNGRSRLSTAETTTQTPSQGERWGEGRSRNSGWGERAGGRGREGGSRAGGRAGSGGAGRAGTGGDARGGTGGVTRGGTRGGARGGTEGGWGEGRRGGAGRAGGRRGGRGGGEARGGRENGGGGEWGTGGGWGADAGNGGGAGGFEGGLGGGEGATQRRFQQMFMQWLMGGGENGGGTGGGGGGGGGGAGNTRGMNGFSNMFWRK
ncbi:glycine-rich cell wall structural protein-like [Mizuhopecten yessoensis]|uniref:glycine-rich cell wall structural protein-like n=1 Tax=Mizuhopecten yessoensis TaxID=6573 RepID=UPI000B459F36|nr:glycine-rich cell wall structural protein-like [Mizuhopecten yessoensis]